MTTGFSTYGFFSSVMAQACYMMKMPNSSGWNCEILVQEPWNIVFKHILTTRVQTLTPLTVFQMYGRKMNATLNRNKCCDITWTYQKMHAIIKAKGSSTKYKCVTFFIGWIVCALCVLCMCVCVYVCIQLRINATLQILMDKLFKMKILTHVHCVICSKQHGVTAVNWNHIHQPI